MSAVIYLLLFLALLTALVALSYVLFPRQMAAVALAADRRLAGLRLRHIQVGRYRIAYLDGGDAGDPREALVLLHGIGADKDNWNRVARGLRDRFRVIAPDLPGFGDSDKPADGDYSIAAQVENVAAFLDALGLTRVHLGGNSMGGWIAAHFAARYPQRVITLWLLAPAGVEGAEPSDMMQRVEAGEAPPLFAQSHEQFSQVLAYVTAKPPFIPGAVRDLLADRAIADYPLHTRIFSELWRDRPALEPVASRITAPTLIVWGEADRVLHCSGAKLLERAIPTAEADLLPGIGHMPMLEAADECADLFRSFRARYPNA